MKRWTTIPLASGALGVLAIGAIPLFVNANTFQCSSL